MDAREEFVVAAMRPRAANQEEAMHLLRQTASAMIAFAANGILSAFRVEGLAGSAASLHPLCYVLHHLVFCIVALVASVLLFLSYSAHKFPTAARRASSVAAAVVRLRRQPRRVFASGLVLLRRDASSLSALFCSVWFVAAFVYVVNPCSLCYDGMVWCALFFAV
ncbi:hypothetical protein MUK42_33542 [Musa troglodytarum]|uniref:Uncharacterized protein n=1 Tax=Musa troglodytarum TaxID=320322 RepID=A0A9E7FWG3_9LILI|nr:hypothetical protein MUK42_33542 [Musa troglodytarum]